MSKVRWTSKSSWLHQRELGLPFPMGHTDKFYKTLYSSIQPFTTWDHNEHISTAAHGGVFNLEYSPDGSLLLAACEKRSVLMFDPLCRKLIYSINNAHNHCVNGARFLDQRMFATCSDDKTVALWDARNLKQRIRTLQGHSNWVKNIEYSPKDGLLLTSGFDGIIFTWDINSFTENSFISTKVFQTNGLMRTRLSPDASKMLICTTSGYLILIHDLQLSTLNQDLDGFKPNMYRLMQLSQTTIPIAASFTHLFSSSRTHNRIEFITDFPVGDDAEVISSLQVHPHGWCALSRNVSADEKSEWTCIHDIQERDENEIANLKQQKEKDPSYLGDFVVEDWEEHEAQQPSQSGITSNFLIGSTNNLRHTAPSFNNSRLNLRTQRDQAARTNSWEEQPLLTSPRSSQRNSRSESSTSEIGLGNEQINGVQEDADGETSAEQRVEAGEISSRRGNNHSREFRRRNISVENGNFPASNVELHVNTSDVWEALVAIREARLRRESERDIQVGVDRRYRWLPRAANNADNLNSVNLPRSSHTVVIVGDRRPSNQNRQGSQTMYAIPRNHRIHQNIPRLTHYIEEPNVGSGYIKELCFSADGRLICSPFGFGVRLLAFSSNCQELSDCAPRPNESTNLYEVATNVSHKDIVVSTKFSPRHCLLVSGCLSGKIVWHQPVL